MEKKVMGYRRADGSVGIRNYVLLIPVDDISNEACEAVARKIQGTTALPHPYGRLQYGEDLDLHFRTLIGTGRNANVAAAIVIGIEPNWTKKIADGIEDTGKPVAMFSIEGQGELETIRQATWKAKEFVQYATDIQREPVELGEMIFSMKCGESDTTTGLASCPTVGRVVDALIDSGATVLFGETSELTGGEHLIAQRCATPELRDEFMKTFDNYVGFIEQQDANLLGSQPTEGNIAGGLSTIEEKAMGNIEKTGTKPVVGVLKPAQSPKAAGLNFMDTSSAAAECVTLMCAAGAVLHFFPTGQGNIVGNPVEPVIKLTGNPKTAQVMREHIDLDVSGLLSYDIQLSDAAVQLEDVMVHTVNGRFTAAESLGHKEFVLTKLYPSA